jgi:hypothetical protein
MSLGTPKKTEHYIIWLRGTVDGWNHISFEHVFILIYQFGKV